MRDTVVEETAIQVSVMHLMDAHQHVANQLPSQRTGSFTAVGTCAEPGISENEHIDPREDWLIADTDRASSLHQLTNIRDPTLHTIGRSRKDSQNQADAAMRNKVSQNHETPPFVDLTTDSVTV